MNWEQRLGPVSVLECPRCGGVNLHHMHLAINVKAEGVKLSIEGQSVTTLPLTNEAAEFFGGREWSLVLGLMCETCGLQLARRVILHHGRTLEDWVI